LPSRTPQPPKKNYPATAALRPTDPNSPPHPAWGLPAQQAQSPRDQQGFLQDYAKTHVGFDYDPQAGQLGHYRIQSPSAQLRGEQPRFEPMGPGYEQWLRERELGEPSTTQPLSDQDFGPDRTEPTPPRSGLQRPHRLGDLSMLYETGHRPGEEVQAAATVSTGKKDNGGRSYGAYQFASSRRGGRQVQQFQREEGAPWASQLDGKDPTAAGAYGDTWKSIPSRDPAFFDAQHNYTQRTHYNPTVDHVRARTGLDINSRSDAVKDAVWSTSVNHGGARGIIEGVVKSLRTPLNSPNYDRDFINALYDARNKYVDGVEMDAGTRANLKARYVKERRDALDMLGQ
jgi:type VI secretion system secreted protein VgrG